MADDSLFVNLYRYNVSQLEDWARDMGAMATVALTELLPIVEASKLLQMRKSSTSHAPAISEHCSHLNALQVCVYIPYSGYTSRV